MGQRPVSLTMIVRDEERHLPDCLGPVRGLFDDIVVADTGSTDRTRQVAAELGARVFDVPWADSFAVARNAALDHARGPWAVRLDADDRLDPDNVAKLKAVLDALPADPVAYTVRYRHDLGPGVPPLEQPDVRIFPVLSDIRWRYRAHEQIGPAVVAVGGRVVATDVRIDHLGHRDPTHGRAKLERNVGLFRRDLAEFPGDPFVLFYLGHTLLGLGRPAEAVEPLQQACRAASPGWSLGPWAWTQLARSHAASGKPARALAACRDGRATFPRDADLAYAEGRLLLAAGHPADAEVRFRFLLSGDAVEGDPPLEPGACGPLARDGLARCLGPDRDAEREALWRAVVSERPDHLPAWVGLGELFAAGKRWAELDGVIGRVATLSPADADVLTARGLAAKGNYPAARGVLRAAAGRHPNAAAVWIALAQVLVLEGKDRRAAERAVRSAARLAPGRPDVARLKAILARWR